MPPPVKYSVDAMLDAARGLVLDGGPMAASARAVSQVTGAPSGSIYHRFPTRDDLVAAAWLRAQDRFLAEFLVALDGPAAVEAGVVAAVRVFTWSAANRADALLLLRFALRDLVRGDVSPALAERAATNRGRVAAAVRGYARRTGRPVEDVTLALVDLPYATTRRVLRDDAADARVIAATTAALERAALLLLR